MKKQKRRKEKGITLIALIITVVVLIILAGIGIGALVNQDGVVDKAKEAKLETEKKDIEEQINIAMLKKAVEIVCKKHDNFKLQFKVEDGEVKQEVLEKNEPQIEDISVENEEQLKRETEKIVRTPFKLEQSYLYKFYIFKFKDGKGGFMLNIHHIIADAWTLAFICNEIIEIYSKIKKNESIETKAIYSYLEYINSEQQYLNSEKYKKF